MNDQAHRAFTPLDTEHSTAFQGLAGAVIVKAIEDACRGDEYAREWLLDDDSGFTLWAQLLNLNPQTARRRVEAYLRDNHGRTRRVNRRAAR